jgi:hypothetical protein
MWKRWLHAHWVLGWALLRHVIFRPFAGRRRDPKLWLERIGREALGPTPVGNWEAASQNARCIGCGLCDVVLCGERRAPAQALQEPGIQPVDISMSQIVQMAARMPSDAPEAMAWVGLLEEHAEAIRALCPSGVDTQVMAGTIRRNAAVLQPSFQRGLP